MKPKTLGYMANVIGIRISRALPVTLLTTTLLVIGFASRVAAQEKKVAVPPSQLPPQSKRRSWTRFRMRRSYALNGRWKGRIQDSMTSFCYSKEKSTKWRSPQKGKLSRARSGRPWPTVLAASNRRNGRRRFMSRTARFLRWVRTGSLSGTRLSAGAAKSQRKGCHYRPGRDKDNRRRRNSSGGRERIRRRGAEGGVQELLCHLQRARRRLLFW